MINLSAARKKLSALSCGTCLDYYHRKEQLLVGGITNMYSIVETLEKADVVVKP